MRELLRLILVLAVSATVAGCAEQAARTANPGVLADTPPETTESVVRRVLRELRFDVIQPSAEEGVIETTGLTGASWFEFWRQDTIGTDQQAWSSLHTIRRRCIVTVSPAADGGSRVYVEVFRERLARPGTGQSDVGRPYSLYNRQVAEPTARDPLRPGVGAWVDMGRDAALETRIMSRIWREIQPPAGAGTATE